MAWTHEDAAHLLRRAGFGGSLGDVDRTVALGPTAAVDALVDFERTSPHRCRRWTWAPSASRCSSTAPMP